MKKVALLVLAAAALMTTSSASFAWGYGYYGHGGYYGPRVGVTIGGPLYYAPPPVYYSPPQVYYVQPPVYYAPPQQTYVEKARDYAYYCKNPAGYYPEVPRCPSGWMKVEQDDAQPR